MKVKGLGLAEQHRAVTLSYALLHAHEKRSDACPVGGDFQSSEAQCHNTREYCPAAALWPCVSSNQADLSSPAFSALLIQHLLKLLLSKQLRTGLSSVCLCSFLYNHPKGSVPLSLSSSAQIPARAALPLHKVGLIFP